jgi:DNA-binding IclR family transcriptional regulator
MYNAPILKKAVEVIKLIVNENKPLGVTDVARSLTISKSTTFGILKALEEEAFLVKDPLSKKYSTGNTLFEIAKKILRTTDVAVTARPYLERLLAAVDETIFLGIREDEGIKVIDLLEPEKEFKISASVGSRWSLIAGVAGNDYSSPLGEKEFGSFSRSRGRCASTRRTATSKSASSAGDREERAQGTRVDLEES